MDWNREVEDRIVVWEAHRGGGGGFEMPESCLAGFEYGWMLGARPEADVNRTADGVFVSVHDSTLDRIVENLPEELKGRPIGELTYSQIRSCDPGGSRVPAVFFACISQKSLFVNSGVPGGLPGQTEPLRSRDFAELRKCEQSADSAEPGKLFQKVHRNWTGNIHLQLV